MCYVVSLTWPLCTTYSQAGGRSDLRQGVSLTRRLRRYTSHFVALCLSLPPNWWRERSPIRSPTLQPPSGINSQYSSKLSQQRPHSQCAGKAASGDRHLHRSQRSRISFNPNRLRLKFNPRRLSSKRSSRQAYLPLTLTPLPKGGECDRRLHSSPVSTNQA